MPRCCQGSTCACAIEAGPRVTVTGVGSANDPYVIEADVGVEVTDNSVFALGISGAGTDASPWVISVNYAATATLDDIPDVDTTGVSNGDVLSWNSGTSTWEPAAPTVAPTGAVTTDTSMLGDGSPGDPLEVNEHANGYLATSAGGLGLSDTGKNRLVQHYVSSAARAVGTAPDLNALTMLDTAPGRIDYWNGTAWVELLDVPRDVGAGEFLQLSGGYTGGALTQMFRQITAVTDVNGQFDMLSVVDLTGYAGVLTLHFQPTETPGFACNALGAVNKVTGQAYKLTDGTAYALQGINGVVTAWLY